MAAGHIINFTIPVSELFNEYNVTLLYVTELVYLFYRIYSDFLNKRIFVTKEKCFPCNQWPRDIMQRNKNLLYIYTIYDI